MGKKITMSEQLKKRIRDKNLQDKVEAFKKDLKELIKKHNIEAHDCEQHDNEENYIGSDYYFKIDGEAYYRESINELIEDLK